MSKVLVYATSDERVHVVHPAPQSRVEGQSEADWLAWVAARSVPEDVVALTMELAELPAYESDKRHQWRLRGGRVVADPTVPHPSASRPRPDPGQQPAAATSPAPAESLATQTKLALIEQELADVRATQEALIRALTAANVNPLPGEVPP
jgi:hypothetical protein